MQKNYILLNNIVKSRDFHALQTAFYIKFTKLFLLTIGYIGITITALNHLTHCLSILFCKLTHNLFTNNIFLTFFNQAIFSLWVLVFATFWQKLLRPLYFKNLFAVLCSY